MLPGRVGVSSPASLVVMLPGRAGAGLTRDGLSLGLVRLGFAVLLRLGSAAGFLRVGPADSVVLRVGSALGSTVGLALEALFFLTGLALLLLELVALLGDLLAGLARDELGAVVLPELEPKLMWQPVRPTMADSNATGTRLR